MRNADSSHRKQSPTALQGINPLFVTVKEKEYRMSCPAITFAEITADKYQTLLATAAAQGLNLAGEQGSSTYQGLDFTWAYDAPGETLTIQCTGKPIFIPCSMIEARIRALIG
jgi:hypothetical protein